MRMASSPFVLPSGALRPHALGHGVPCVFASERDVSVLCGCSCFLPLSSLLYCKACKKVQCEACSNIEVDSLSCPACLESVASSEACMLLNRCKKCFQCPRCSAAMRYLAVAKPSASGAGTPSSPAPGASAQGVVCYLQCSYCHWSTMGSECVGDTPAQLAAKCVSNEKAARENSEFKATKERLQKEERERNRRAHSALRFGRLSVEGRAEIREKGAWSTRNVEALEEEKQAALQFAAKTPPVSQSFEGEGPYEVLTGREEPAFEWPARTPLMARPIHRCSGCDKLLVKHSMSAEHAEPQSNQSLMLSVPAMTIRKPHIDGAIQLELCNPTDTVLSVCVSNSSEGERSQLGVPCNFEAKAEHRVLVLPDEHMTLEEDRARAAASDGESTSDRRGRKVCVRIALERVGSDGKVRTRRAIGIL